MSNKNRVSIDLEELENVNGGTLTFNPDGNGGYKMTGCFSGSTFSGVSLSQVMQVIKYSAKVPNTEEGEQQIIQWAQDQGIINK